MTKVVISVTKLGLNYCSLSQEMILAILTASGRTGTRLRYLGLIRSDLCRVPVTTLARAKTRLDSLNLNYCKMTKEQKSCLMQM